jgi:phosphoglycerate dehydrogenase-like enzyme
VTSALLAALESGRLRAGLDVTDPEPLPRGHPLWKAPNLMLTPHVGGGSAGWDRRGYRLVRAQLERFVSGLPLENMIST